MSPLELARRAAKKAKKVFRHNQRQYLRRKAVKKNLVKADKEFYAESCRAFAELCQTLRDCNAILRGKLTEHEANTTRAQREALQFAAGFRLGQETTLREQAALTQK
jgi:hypothetical protein